MKRDTFYRVLHSKNKFKKNTQLNLDFDILIMLDSCRYDFFKLIYFEYLKGKLKKFYSCGCDTKSWIENSAKYVINPDDFYFITANPYFSKGKQLNIIGSFLFKYYPVFDWFIHKDYNVVHPETLTNVAIEESYNHYDKKLVIWFMQPHYPYFDTKGHLVMQDLTPFLKDEISLLEVEEIYKDNLKFVLIFVKRLVDYFLENQPNKKILISSDHSELFGERHIYGHPYGVFYKRLQEVPLLEVEP